MKGKKNKFERLDSVYYINDLGMEVKGFIMVLEENHAQVKTTICPYLQRIELNKLKKY